MRPCGTEHSLHFGVQGRALRPRLRSHGASRVAPVTLADPALTTPRTSTCKIAILATTTPSVTETLKPEAQDSGAEVDIECAAVEKGRRALSRGSQVIPDSGTLLENRKDFSG